MYCTFYGLNQRPFTLTPNPEFIFLGTAHQEAFAHLIYGIENKVGFILLTGEVGAGKTTVIRTLLTRLASEKHATALILNPMLSSLGLLKTINREFGLPDTADEPAELVDGLNRFLLGLKQQGKTAVLVIDEAQDLEPALLEQVRLLSNLETDTEKLIQIILVGQPELEPLLGRQELRQLNQRITVRYHLTPMDASDTREYLAHRLRVAGGKPAMIRFSDTAVAAIQRYSAGLPRLVNAVADRSLLIGYTAEARLLEPAHVRQALHDLTPGSRAKQRNSIRTLTLVLPVLMLLVISIVIANRFTSRVSRPAPLARLQQELAANDACTALLRAWGSSAVCSGQPETTLQQAGFELFRYTGNLGSLDRLKLPALLETVSTTGQKQFMLFGGLDQDQALLADQTGKLVAVSAAQLEQVWTGKALIPWKNQRRLQVPVPYTRNSAELSKLAGLLAAGGLLQQDSTVSADKIRDAIKRFQQQQGLEAAGVAGAQTLLLLYQAEAGYRPPYFKRSEKNQP